MLRVLFVCTGNICRSPIAHGLLLDRSRRLLGGAIEARSAGTWARGGSPPTSEAVSAAAEVGIEIAEHRSSGFTAELGKWADLVVTMTAEQRDEVLHEAPEARVRTFTLKELAAILPSMPPPQGPPSRVGVVERIAGADRVRAQGDAARDEDVADPLGMSPLVYSAVARELEGLVDELVRGLIGEHDPVLAQGG